MHLLTVFQFIYLLHAQGKLTFIIESMKSFGSLSGGLKQSRSGNRKQTYIFFGLSPKENHCVEADDCDTIHYFSSRQVIWSDIRCLDFIFPEPEGRGIFNPDSVCIRPYNLSGAEIIFFHTANPI